MWNCKYIEFLEERLDDLHVTTILQVRQIESLTETWDRKRLGHTSRHGVLTKTSPILDDIDKFR